MGTTISIILAFMLTISGASSAPSAPAGVVDSFVLVSSAQPVTTVGTGETLPTNGKPLPGKFFRTPPFSVAFDSEEKQIANVLSLQPAELCLVGRFLQTDPMGYTDSMNLYQAFNMNPVNFTDPMGLKITADDYRTLKKIFNEQKMRGAQNWIDKNPNFDNAEKLRLGMNLWFGIPDPDQIEADRYKTNAWTVFKDTIDGIGYDVAGKTYCKFAAGALHNDPKLILSSFLDITLSGVGGGIAMHYIPIGIQALTKRFPFLNSEIKEVAKRGSQKAKEIIIRGLDKLIKQRNWRGTKVIDGITVVEDVGAFGEHIAEDLLKSSGYSDFKFIKNASDNGIDVIARSPDGRLSFFEIKTGYGKVPSLSSRQSSMRFFVRDVLENAANRTGPYRNISIETQRAARMALRELNRNPNVVSGNVIGIELEQGVIRISKWPE